MARRSTPSTGASQAKPSPAPVSTSSSPTGDEASSSSSEAEGSAPPAAPPAASTSDAPVAATGADEGTPSTDATLGGGDDQQGNEDGAEHDDAGLELGGRTIMVRSTSDRGRRRAGIAFGPKPRPVQVDDLTEDQLGGLLADPQLIVSLDD